MSTEFGIILEMIVIAAQHCECTLCHWIIHFKRVKMIKMVNKPQEGNCFPEDICLHKELLDVSQPWPPNHWVLHSSKCNRSSYKNKIKNSENCYINTKNAPKKYKEQVISWVLIVLKEYLFLFTVVNNEHLIRPTGLITKMY